MASAPKRPSTRRGIFIGIAIGLGGTLVLTLTTLAVLGVFSGVGEFSASERDIVVDGEHLAVELTVPDGLAIDEVAANPDNSLDPDCRGVRYEFGSELIVEAFASDCAVDEGQQIINGDHGVYRTMADVPEPVDVEEVATPAGPAQVFVQQYAEYTNTRTAWDEPVAIVALDDPVDPDFPTLVLRSDKEALSRESLTAIVRSLSPIEHQTG